MKPQTQTNCEKSLVEKRNPTDFIPVAWAIKLRIKGVKEAIYDTADHMKIFLASKETFHL